MSCKGLCDRYKLVNVRRNNGGNNGCLSYYSEINPDRKYCARCAIRIIWSGINCPCCQFKLRTKPRNYKVNGATGQTQLTTNHTNLDNITILNEPVDPIDILVPLPLLQVVR